MIGTSLAQFRITAKLGEGGMGEVWRAEDTKLGREVAIKVLPERFVADPERLARFEREARLLASLSHPNVAAIYEVSEENGQHFLVMELAAGETLAERLARGPLPLEEALPIALQLSEALEAAHERGVVHRDLKPANVMVDGDGRIKVLDFGLARALEPDRGPTTSTQLDHSPTLTAAATAHGVILGTAAYMAPEQARGLAVDRRADVWAFGVVLWEMLAGERLFGGETVTDTLAEVLKSPIDSHSLPASSPPALRRLLRRCLARERRNRLHDIADVRILLTELLAGETGEEGGLEKAPGRRGWRSLAPWAAVAVAATLGLGVVLGRSSTSGSHQLPLLHSTLLAPEGYRFGESFALSPDGRRLAFSGHSETTLDASLWIRDLGDPEARRLPDTEGAWGAFWSPDGRHLGFFADGKLKRIAASGGPPQTLCDAPVARGGAWGPAGRIVFAGSFRTGLSAVSATGGEPVALTELDAGRGEKSHRWPHFLPDGRTLLFLAQTAEGHTPDDESTIEALDLASGERHSLVRANSSFQVVPPGVVLFWRQGTLMAQSFDGRRLAVTGDPRPLISGVDYTVNEQALFTASEEGTLAYVMGQAFGKSHLVWVDRAGRELMPIAGPEVFEGGLALSPDGTRLAVGAVAGGARRGALWIHDLGRGTASRLTFEDGDDGYPIWTRDGTRIFYSNNLAGDGTIFARSASGMGARELVLETAEGAGPEALTADGTALVVTRMSAETDMDIWRYSLAEGTLEPLVQSPFVDVSPALSADDRWLAYMSEESGRPEIYVQGFSEPSSRWQVSSGGGLFPHWSLDGRELYFVAPPNRLMVVEIEEGHGFVASSARELFRAPFVLTQARPYDVAADRERFVVHVRPEEIRGRPLTLVQGWQQLLASAR